MKELADGKQVSSRIYYYLLDFNEQTNWAYLKNTLNKIRLMDLNISEFTQLFEHATKTDSVLLKQKIQKDTIKNCVSEYAQMPHLYVDCKEFILCSAVYVNDKKKHNQQPKNVEIGYVVIGRQHHNCFQTITDLKGDSNEYIRTLELTEKDYSQMSGFLTSLNRYVGRKEAWQIAKLAGQIKYGLIASENGEDSILISENLYDDEA